MQRGTAVKFRLGANQDRQSRWDPDRRGCTLADGRAYNRIHVGAAPESVGLANIPLNVRAPAATSKQIRGEAN